MLSRSAGAPDLADWLLAQDAQDDQDLAALAPWVGDRFSGETRSF